MPMLSLELGLTLLTHNIATISLEPLTNLGVGARAGTPPSLGREGLAVDDVKLNPSTQHISPHKPSL